MCPFCAGGYLQNVTPVAKEKNLAFLRSNTFKPNHKFMSTLKERPVIDKDLDPLFNMLQNKFPENYCPDDIMLSYCEKYSVLEAKRYLLEMFLRIEWDSDLLKVSIEELNVFMEDTADLLTAIYVCSEEKKLPYNVEV